MFDEMISRKLIEVIWVLASIGVVINGLVLMLAGGGGWSFLLALIFIAIGLLVVRVSCELMIVIFKIHENLEQSTFALTEIRRTQPEILAKLTPRIVEPALKPQAVRAAGSASTIVEQATATQATYHDKMSAVREQLQQQSRNSAPKSSPAPAPGPSRSKLGEWPGASTTSGQ